jgi:hypothetical protein
MDDDPFPLQPPPLQQQQRLAAAAALVPRWVDEQAVQVERAFLHFLNAYVPLYSIYL